MTIKEVRAQIKELKHEDAELAKIKNGKYAPLRKLEDALFSANYNFWGPNKKAFNKALQIIKSSGLMSGTVVQKTIHEINEIESAQEKIWQDVNKLESKLKELTCRCPDHKGKHKRTQ